MCRIGIFIDTQETFTNSQATACEKDDKSSLKVFYNSPAGNANRKQKLFVCKVFITMQRLYEQDVGCKRAAALECLG